MRFIGRGGGFWRAKAKSKALPPFDFAQGRLRYTEAAQRFTEEIFSRVYEISSGFSVLGGYSQHCYVHFDWNHAQACNAVIVAATEYWRGGGIDYVHCL